MCSIVNYCIASRRGRKLCASSVCVNGYTRTKSESHLNDGTTWEKCVSGRVLARKNLLADI